MDTSKPSLSLEQIPADRKLVEELYVNDKITNEAREYALNLLYPHDQWGLWISRLLLVIGSALLLSGVIYFFAYNWERLSTLFKFILIQLGILGCLAGAYYRSLEKLSGQVFLLSASVLIGVFFAVYGQIYQTGADAYQLFMMWALLIIGWVIISKFTALWAVWLVIINTFLVLFWIQAVMPSDKMQFMIFSYLALLNGASLALREYYVEKNQKWLDVRWTRAILSVAVLLAMLIPIIAFIVTIPKHVTVSITISAVIGLMGHGILFFIYRQKIPDMWSLCATVLSACIIIEVAGGRLLFEIFEKTAALFYLLMGGMTLGVFTYAIMYLRQTATAFEVSDV